MSSDFALTGTHQGEPEAIRLAAGPLTADLINGNLRTISHGGTEVLRAIGYIVRDRDWGTYEPTISNFSLDQDDDGFSLSYEAECVSAGGARLRFSTRITGSAHELVFTTTATPDGDFETNRCGFCILHPIVGLSGSPVSVEHTDGSVVETVLPDLIDPWQPFKDMRAISHVVRPGLMAKCLMEGDTFEMEDQRNWSDGSYKTYVRPLALPWPYVLPAGKPQTQTVTLVLSAESDEAAAQPKRAPAAPSVAPGPPLPRIGVVIYPEDVSDALTHIEHLADLAPQALLFHFDPADGHGADAIQSFAALTAHFPAPATLEIAVPCKQDLDIEMEAVAALVRDAGLALDSLIVSPSVDRQSTPPGSKWPDCPPLDAVYAAARRAFPDVRLGGGMLSYFTELNRKRVPAEKLGFITHCTCPIVHASDDLSVMQSLEALTPITRSVRAFYGDMPYRIGPSTIAMRQNPYGSSTKDNPHLVRIAMANRDPRHNALFGAAWAVGYASRIVQAGLEQFVPSAFAGPFGLMAAAGEPVPEGGRRPLFHVVKALAALAGMQSIRVDVGPPSHIAAAAVRKPDGEIAGLAANLTGQPLEIDIEGLAGQGGELSILDAETVSRDQGWRVARRNAGALQLSAYAVVRIG